jgi:hypothetical protein
MTADSGVQTLFCFASSLRLNLPQSDLRLRLDARGEQQDDITVVIARSLA